MNFQNTRIGTKLWLAVGSFIVVLATLIGFATVRASQAQAYADKVLTLTETKIRLATRWSHLTEAAVTRAMASAITTDAAVTKVLGDANTTAIAKITELQDELKGLPQTEAEQALTQKIALARQAVLDALDKVAKVKDGGDLEAARKEATQRFAPLVVPYLQTLNDFVKLQEDGLAAAQAHIAADRKLTLTIAMVVVGLIVAGMMIGTHLLVKSIRTPLLDAVALAGRIAAGDLGSKTQVTRGDEMGDLLRALLEMNESLARTVGQVRSAADSIQTASTEIASGNTDLSRRTEETASNLQKTASAIEQLTGTVGQSAESARTANQLASSAAQVAHRGGVVVSQVVSTMDEINGASKRIADIIGVIDGIAFQTNILALNAAVEAARAGEQGRGFAVVASEVRSLAQRSAEAAREIKTLIGASVERVESGSRLVADAGSTMGEIVASVQRVSDIIGEISAAAAEQRQGIGQVNSAIGQLDQMTQQNAALVEESAAAAESLREQSRQLAGVVSAFRLDSSSGFVQAMAAAAAPAAPAVVARKVIAQVKAASKPLPAKPQPAAAAKPAPRATAPVAAAPTPLVKPAAHPAPGNDSDSDWETF